MHKRGNLHYFYCSLFIFNTCNLFLITLFCKGNCSIKDKRHTYQMAKLMKHTTFFLRNQNYLHKCLCSPIHWWRNYRRWIINPKMKNGNLQYGINHSLKLYSDVLKDKQFFIFILIPSRCFFPYKMTCS